MKIGIAGCAGRMGRALMREVLLAPGLALAPGLEHKASPHVGDDLGTLLHEETQSVVVTDDVAHFVHEADVVIDFTTPAATLALAKAAAEAGTPQVIGTTGLSGEDMRQLERHAQQNALLWSANMSVGVNVLLALSEQVAATMDPSYDIEIVEMHHRHKVDAPSGTALALGRAAATGRKEALADVACYAREGQLGPRTEGEIGFATLRGGDVIGDHTVMFAGEGERLELTHKASNRKVFASGAVRAARWLAGQEPGLYHMRDMLGL